MLVLAACTGEPVEVPNEPPIGQPVPDDVAQDIVEPERSDSDLLHELGELLSAAATTGGDALDRTLRVTSYGAYDPDCAPVWAHELLAVAAEGAAPVSAQASDLTVGDVAIPVDVVNGRAVHLGGDCGSPLPQPNRQPEPTVSAADAAPLQEPTPEPAPVPVPAETTAAPPAPAPQIDARAVAFYDEELELWARTILVPYYDLVRQYEGMGGRQVTYNLEDISYSITGARTHFWGLNPPVGRGEAHQALLDGLEWWSLEVKWQATCSSNMSSESCRDWWQESRARRQSHFEVVTNLTGIAMPGS